MTDLFRHWSLRTDVSGMPIGWVNYRDATRLYHLGHVAYACGRTMYRIHGGINAKSGQRSIIEINSIIATLEGHHKRNIHSYTPPLSNTALFVRDAHICLYCGNMFSSVNLSRDHVTPLSQGGQDTWNNVVTACKRCNNHKAGSTPEQAGMKLLAVPFTPTHVEYVYMRGREVMADQMEFLLAHFPRTSPLHERLQKRLAG